MQVQPYLFFEGRCDEALSFYSTTLGAQVTALMRYSDSPEPHPPGMLPPGSDNKVMHCNFTVGESQVMASDGMCSGKPSFQGITLAISPDTAADAKRVFDALADGGKVDMPLGETFFSHAFGMLTDRFGVAWMVNVAKPA
jgi:PhnB protein